MQDTLIGIDIGTTAVKAVLCDLAGARIDTMAQAYPATRVDGGVEQDPGDWWRLTSAVLDRFAAAGTQVRAIGVTSQVNTHVFCDAGLAPLRPAIVWQDGRAAPDAALLEAAIDAEIKRDALGAPIPIDASHALARMAMVARIAPQVWAATAHVLLPKDWIVARLSGAIGSDPISAVGLVGADLAYAQAVLALVPRAAAVLPPLADPRQVAGTVTGGAFAGVPVVTGTMDAWASMFGTGVARTGQAMNLSGTSEVLGLISDTHIPEPGVITFPPWAGIRLHAGPTQAGGASLDWVGRLTGLGPDAMSALAEATPIRPDGPLFLPHLAGERAPLWDATARGTFAGLTAADGPAEAVVAVMEGVAFSARLALEALERAGGCRAEVIQAGGGGTASDAWCAIRADAFGRPYRRMQAREAGAVGAMVLAGVGAGVMPDLATAAETLVPEDRVFHPDPAGQALANRRYAIWRTLYAQVRRVNAALQS